MKMNAQLRRITRYEALFDEVSAAVADLNRAVDRVASLKAQAAELEAYYTGRLWKKDFADDENGRLPPELKRGVLAEDGLYNLLDELRALEGLFDHAETEIPEHADD